MNINLKKIGIKATNQEEHNKLVEFYRENGYDVKHMKEHGVSNIFYWGETGYYINGRYSYTFNKTYESLEGYKNAQKMSEENKTGLSPLPESYQIEVCAPDMSELVQKRLFAMGYKWGNSDQTVKRVNAKWLQIWEEKAITESGDERFEDKEFPVVSLRRFLLLAVPQVKFKINDYSVRTEKETVFVEGAENFSFPIEKLKEIKEAIEPQKLPSDFFIPAPTKELFDIVQRKINCNLLWDEEVTGIASRSSIFPTNCGREYWEKQTAVKIIAIDQLFEEKKISIKLTEKFSAEITKDFVSVGCQKNIPIAEVKKLIEFFKV